MKQVGIVLGVALLLLALVTIFFDREMLFFQTFLYMSEKIQGEGIVHPRIAEMIAVVFAGLVVLGAGLFFSFSGRKRAFGFAIFVITACTFTGLRWVMSRDHNFAADGRRIRYLESQPDGGVLAVYRKMNPYTGRPNVPVTGRTWHSQTGSHRHESRSLRSSAWSIPWAIPWCGMPWSTDSTSFTTDREPILRPGIR